MSVPYQYLATVSYTRAIVAGEGHRQVSGNLVSLCFEAS